MHVSEQQVRNLVARSIRFLPNQFRVSRDGANNLTVALLRESRGASATPQRHNFQGYSSGGMNVRVRTGSVRTAVPSNMTIEIEVPSNVTDGYFVWVKSERIGDHFSDGVTSIIEHGATLPTAPASSGGLPPAWTFHPLFYVVTGDETIISIEQIVYTNMWINENPIQSCLQTIYDLEWVYGTFVGEA